MALELELCSVDGTAALKSRSREAGEASFTLRVAVSTLAYEENFSSGVRSCVRTAERWKGFERRPPPPSPR